MFFLNFFYPRTLTINRVLVEIEINKGFKKVFKKPLLPYIASGIKSHQTCCLLLTAVEKQPYLHGGLFFSLRMEIVCMHEQFLDKLSCGCNNVTKSSNGCRPYFDYPLKQCFVGEENPALHIQVVCLLPFWVLNFSIRWSIFCAHSECSSQACS